MKRRYSKHGMTGTKIHEVWKEMKRRVKGNYYGTRVYKEKGITVCSQWQEADSFIKWAMENGYKEGLQLDRKDNDGNYCPKNCRWVTPKENCRNRATTKWLEFKGKTETIDWWSNKTGINVQTLRTRLARGWSTEKALTRKTQKRSK